MLLGPRPQMEVKQKVNKADSKKSAPHKKRREWKKRRALPIIFEKWQILTSVLRERETHRVGEGPCLSFFFKPFFFHEDMNQESGESQRPRISVLEEASPGTINLSPLHGSQEPLETVYTCWGEGRMCIFLDLLIQSIHQLLKALSARKS